MFTNPVQPRLVEVAYWVGFVSSFAVLPSQTRACRFVQVLPCAIISRWPSQKISSCSTHHRGGFGRRHLARTCGLENLQLHLSNFARKPWTHIQLLQILLNICPSFASKIRQVQVSLANIVQVLLNLDSLALAVHALLANNSLTLTGHTQREHGTRTHCLHVSARLQPVDR